MPTNEYEALVPYYDAPPGGASSNDADGGSRCEPDDHIWVEELVDGVEQQRCQMCWLDYKEYNEPL